MSRPNWLQKIYWNNFGKPVRERALHQALLNSRFSSVLEIGVGEGARMRRIAQLIQPSSGTDTIRYIGTDEFESATDGERHLTLKQAHQLASQLGFKASLIPGDATSALPRVAHKLGVGDLVIINGGLDLTSPSTGPIGTWLNRVAHEGSTVVASQDSESPLTLVDMSWLNQAIRAAA